jgi:hypothetical protein
MQVQPSKILSQASQLAAQIEQLEVQLQGLLQGAQGLQEAKKPELGTALAEAFERGDHVITRILAQPNMLTAKEFAARLNVPVTALRERVRRHKVLALSAQSAQKAGVRFPAWQITPDGKEMQGLPALFDRLPEPWAVFRFLTQHHPELNGKTAAEALKAGHIKEVLNAADNARHGFS